MINPIIGLKYNSVLMAVPKSVPEQLGQTYGVASMLDGQRSDWSVWLVCSILLDLFAKFRLLSIRVGF